MENEKKEVESPSAWRPEPGKTAWTVYSDEIHEVIFDGYFEQDGRKKAWIRDRSRTIIGKKHAASIPADILFPTAEAALASIKVYDINGVEVPQPDMENIILGELNLASRGRGAFLEMKDLQVRAKIEEAMRCNEAGLKSATSLHLGEALRLLKERSAEGGDLTKSTLEVPRPNLQDENEALKALLKISGIAYTMDFPENKDGASRLKAAQERFAALPPTRTLTEAEKTEVLALAIQYAEAVGFQEDGMDRASVLVYDSSEKLIAFVENREPEIDDEY